MSFSLPTAASKQTIKRRLDRTGEIFWRTHKLVQSWQRGSPAYTRALNVKKSPVKETPDRDGGRAPSTTDHTPPQTTKEIFPSCDTLSC
jgi:hypothetical protein